MSTLQEEISRRRTFAIISHPDAGKTTLTEKFLLYGGAIAARGRGQGQEERPSLPSLDWMEIEKQRGISVTSSVMQFQLRGLLHQHPRYAGPSGFLGGHLPHAHGGRLRRSWSSTAARGVEPQTRKLFKVCAVAPYPDLHVCQQDGPRGHATRSTCSTQLEQRAWHPRPMPVNWPIGCGKEFQGVYDRRGQRHRLRSLGDGAANARAPGRESGAVAARRSACSASSSARDTLAARCVDDVELLDGAGREFDMDAGPPRPAFSPVFFGSALTNFGVEPFLEAFLQDDAAAPVAHVRAACGVIDRLQPGLFRLRLQNSGKYEQGPPRPPRLPAHLLRASTSARHGGVPCAGRPQARACRSPSSSWRRSARSSTRPTPGISSACSIPASSPSATPSPRRAKSSAFAGHPDVPARTFLPRQPEGHA